MKEFLTTKDIIAIEKEMNCDFDKVLEDVSKHSKVIKTIAMLFVDPEGELPFGIALKKATELLNRTFEDAEAKN